MAHNKFITFEDYDKCTKNLRIINKQLSLAIHNLYSQIYSEETISYIGTLLSTAFSEFFKNNATIFDAVQKSLITIGKIFSEISDSLTKSLGHNIQNTYKGVSVSATTSKIEGSSCLQTSATTCELPIHVKDNISTTLDTRTKSDDSKTVNIKTSNHTDKSININSSLDNDDI